MPARSEWRKKGANVLNADILNRKRPRDLDRLELSWFRGCSVAEGDGKGVDERRSCDAVK